MNEEYAVEIQGSIIKGAQNYASVGPQDLSRIGSDDNDEIVENADE